MFASVIPVLIVTIVVIFVASRYRGAGGPLHRARADRRLLTPARPARERPGPPGPGLLPLPGDIGLVAARELRQRTRSRAFRIGTLLILLAVGAAIIVPALRASHPALAHPAVAACTPAPSRGTARQDTSLVGLLLLFFMLTQYNAWTLTGVLEEKSSRVVEVLLAATSPARLLSGKLLGIGLAAFVQAGVTVGVAAGLARAVHSSAVTGLTAPTVAATACWLILGYSFFSWLYAAAGSTADRPEQAQSLLLPLGLPVIFGYVTAFTAATSGHASLLVHVLAYLPPTAPFAMPVLVSLNAVAWWQFALSVMASIACTIGVARLAVTVYRASILRTGSRVAVRELLSAHRRLSTVQCGQRCAQRRLALWSRLGTTVD